MTPTWTTAKFDRRLPRAIRDFLLGLTLFTVVAVTCLAGAPDCSGLISNPAQARMFEIEPVAEDLAVAFAMGNGGAMESVSQQFMALFSLALAFASVFAFNMWFARQLKRVHAVERRGR